MVKVEHKSQSVMSGGQVLQADYGFRQEDSPDRKGLNQT